MSRCSMTLLAVSLALPSGAWAGALEFDALYRSPAAALRGGAAAGGRAVAAVSGAEAAADYLWGAEQVRGAGPPTRFKKWTAVVERQRSDRSRAWRAYFEDLRGRPEKEQLDETHARWNRVPYRADGADNPWDIPSQFLLRGGDCEEYAIAKYFSLRELGWPASRLRVVIVHNQNLGLKHAVLLAEQGGATWTLDNLHYRVYEPHENGGYAPLSAFNEDSWWGYRQGDSPATLTLQNGGLEEGI